MKLREILHHKGSDVLSASPSDTLGDAVLSLVKNNCGALMVMEDDRAVGIITERDVLRACAELPQPLAASVRDHMTTELITATPDDHVEHVMGLMTNHRIRHLPIMEAGKLVGIISIGDVVKSQHDELSNENRYLKQYIQG
ncbi:MAG: CBS domain-containing protein [Gammaproteobacteria bacterium]|nr:CBS domain-containing protein [Gammaproteobacteria bacterium]